MPRFRFRRPALLALAILLCVPVAGLASVCVQDTLPVSPNYVRTTTPVLCSPDSNEVQTRIVPGGLLLTWLAPPLLDTAFESLVYQVTCDSVACQYVPFAGVALDQDHPYLGSRDRSIELTVTSVGLGDSTPTGIVGQDSMRLSWITNRLETGQFDLTSRNASAPLRFDIEIQAGSPPDTTALPGVRIRFQAGTRLPKNQVLKCWVEDFEGWHIWRWRADPSSANVLAVDEYAKNVDWRLQPRWLVCPNPASPACQSIDPSLRLVSFLDTDVQNGFLYYYAITVFDEGFDPGRGKNYARKFESQSIDQLRARGSKGSYVLSPTQIRVDYRTPPPQVFRPIAAVPNPFREAANDGTRESQLVQFVNAPPKGTLYIYTIAGDLVLERDHDLSEIGVITWDTRNGAGQKVASGVYIYKIVDRVSGEQSYGRMCIIR